MADAELTRVIAAPLRQVVKALERIDARDGNPTAAWNATKTAITDVSPDGTIDISLKAVDAGSTALTIAMTANDPQMSMLLKAMGTMFLGEAMDEIVKEVELSLGSGDLDL